MSHQDKIAAGNAFWREMLDQLPCTNLIFRIDQDEQAQLFFVNTHIRRDLGFSPEEYVLGSESEGMISGELKSLVDEIARLSHEDTPDEPQFCELTSRDKRTVRFAFDFRIFQSRVSRINLISVSLFPVDMVAAGISTEKPRKQKNISEVLQLPFVAESEVMKSILDRVDMAAHQNTNVILHGEPGTGRRTLARRMIDTIRLTGGSFNLYELDPANRKQDDLQELLKDSNRFSELRAIRDMLVLFVADLGGIDKGVFPEIISLINSRADLGRATRLVVTSHVSLEQLAEKGKIPSDLIYTHTFLSIAVPPLRHRKADIPVLASKWAKRLTTLLDIPPVEFTEAQIFQLQEFDWPENLNSFSEAIRIAVLGAKNGRPDIKSSTMSAGKPGLPETRTKEDVLTFDDMSRKYLQQVLKITNGKIYGDDGAAALLGMKPTTLQSKLKKLKVR